MDLARVANADAAGKILKSQLNKEVQGSTAGNAKRGDNCLLKCFVLF